MSQSTNTLIYSILQKLENHTINSTVVKRNSLIFLFKDVKAKARKASVADAKIIPNWPEPPV